MFFLIFRWRTRSPSHHLSVVITKNPQINLKLNWVLLPKELPHCVYLSQVYLHQTQQIQLVISVAARKTIVAKFLCKVMRTWVSIAAYIWRYRFRHSFSNTIQVIVIRVDGKNEKSVATQTDAATCTMNVRKTSSKFCQIPAISNNHLMWISVVLSCVSRGEKIGEYDWRPCWNNPFINQL